MSAISNSGGGSIWNPTEPVLEFWEYRAPAWMIINPVFVDTGNGKWEYTIGKYTVEITLPCWDKDYDWEAVAERVKKRHKQPFPWLSRL